MLFDKAMVGASCNSLILSKALSAVAMLDVTILMFTMTLPPLNVATSSVGGTFNSVAKAAVISSSCAGPMSDASASIVKVKPTTKL